MRGKACSAEFMRRLERILEGLDTTPLKHQVRAVCAQTCLAKAQVYQLLRVRELEKQVRAKVQLTGKPQPTIFIEALGAPDPLALATQAIDEDWTAARVRTEAKKANQAKAGPLPPGEFDVILADPPWPYANQIASWGPAELHYRTEDMSEILNLKPPAADHATLFLWTTNPFLKEGLAVIEAWGFQYKTNIVWIKRQLRRPGSGFYVRGHHELLLLATRGRHVPDMSGKAPVSSIIEAPLREHSRKPVEAYALIENLYPQAQRLELFARGTARTGWTAWGDERTI